MPAIGVVPEQAVRKLQGPSTLGDINLRGKEHWHLEDPHNKALAALVYTSVFKGAWDIVARSSASLFGFLHQSNRQALPERTRVNGNTNVL